MSPCYIVTESFGADNGTIRGEVFNTATKGFVASIHRIDPDGNITRRACQHFRRFDDAKRWTQREVLY